MNDQHGRETLGHRLLRPPSRIGLAIALPFWWMSLYPTLMPRSALHQGALSALSFLVGYGFGVVVAVVGRAVVRPVRPDGTGLSAVVQRRLSIALAVVWGAFVLLGALRWITWQNDQRDLVLAPHLDAVMALPMLLVTVVVIALLLPLGRLGGWVIATLDRVAAAHMPAAAAHAVIAGVLIVVAVGGTRRAVIEPVFTRIDDAFGSQEDSGADPGIVQPTSALRSGGPGSLAPWGTLGFAGRNFIGAGPTKAEIQEYWGAGTPVVEPIRVYAGLKSAPSPEEQAALAVRELDRTGAAQRAVVVVVTVTGTGWINPVAADTLEMMHRGNTAIVATQYSYLPSWVSFLVDEDKAVRNAKALQSAVRTWWSGLPADRRPKLILFGESLGSFGSEAAVKGADVAASITNVTTFDGALWVGPTNGNPVFNQVIANRDPGSPVWQPVLDGGKVVRFMPRPADLGFADPAWKAPRIAYLSHPSDPVTWWSMSTLYRPPRWMKSPTGYDISSPLGWWPVVTWLQELVDLINGFGAAAGHGHNYTSDLVGGWAAVVPPEGWTQADSRRLQDHYQLDPRPPG